MIRIRHAEAGDIPALAQIDNFYIEHTNITFDTAPKSEDYWNRWLGKYKTTGPHQAFVAEENNQVIGSCYSSRYREHVAFDRTVETSIYLAPGNRSKGVGSLLYQNLFEALNKENLHSAVVGIALPNEASIALHKKFGFSEVGIFKEYAHKNGTFISSIWLQKDLAN